MAFKVGLLCLTLYIGSNALPAVERDPSSLLNHTDASSRIVGGSVAGKVPHMVALTNGTKVRQFFCGGSLVTNRHVLTAAHCIKYVTINGILDKTLRGTVGSNRWNSGGTQIVFARGIIHEDYKPEPIVKNDIGILVSISTVPLSDTVKLINLNYNWVDGGVPTTVHGWGWTSVKGPISKVLLQLNAKVLDGDNCVKELPYRLSTPKWFVSHVDPKLEICTFHSADRGICKGDSGGALLRSDTNEQIGIASWVIFPCAHNFPDVFVRISAYKNWLKKNLI